MWSTRGSFRHHSSMTRQSTLPHCYSTNWFYYTYRVHLIHLLLWISTWSIQQLSYILGRLEIRNNKWFLWKYGLGISLVEAWHSDRIVLTWLYWLKVWIALTVRKVLLELFYLGILPLILSTTKEIDRLVLVEHL